MTVMYVDVSHHDWNRTKGQLDWARIRAATSPVMCARATYGDPAGYNPPSYHFADMVRGARAAGFDVLGGYHNLVAGDSASINRQVDYLRRTLDGAGANWAMLDVERYDELVHNGLYPRMDDVRQFVDRWHAVDKRVLTVYLPRWIWDGHLGRPDLRVLGCPLVASDYGGNLDGSPAGVYSARGGDSGRGWTAYGGVAPAIWQYGSNVDCPGASGQTDCNAYRGTLAQLRALLTGQPEEDDMTPEEHNALFYVKDLLARWRGGHTFMSDGKTDIAPVDWRIRDEKWQAAVTANLVAIGQAAGLDPAELEQIKAAAREGAAAGADQIVAAVVAQLPDGSDPVSREDLVAALRSVLGSVDNPPAS